MTYEELLKRYYVRDCGINAEEIYPAVEIRPIKMQSGNWKMKKEKTHKLMHRPIFCSIISYEKYFFVDRYA
jgi:hypothetical protein